MRSLHGPGHRRATGSRGAAAIVTAIALVGLLGAGAIVLDIGALYEERRELQNGADAAAFSLAKDCASSSCANGQSVVNKAEEFADLNADDGNSVVELVCGNGTGLSACPVAPGGLTNATGYVLVKTASGAASATPTTAGSGYAAPSQINYTFGQALKSTSPSGSVVRAQAVAAWGPPGSGSTIPITISVCEHSWAVGSPATYPSPERILTFHVGTGINSSGCPLGPAGQDVSGGFGWLRTTGDGNDSDCMASVTVGGTVGADTGNNTPSCVNLPDWQNKTLLIPIYDNTGGNGAGAWYRVAGFGAFEITGYKFGGNTKWPNNNSWGCPGPGNSGNCLRGRFVKYVSAGANSFGTTNYGASVLRMVG